MLAYLLIKASNITHEKKTKHLKKYTRIKKCMVQLNTIHQNIKKCYYFHTVLHSKGLGYSRIHSSGMSVAYYFAVVLSFFVFIFCFSPLSFTLDFFLWILLFSWFICFSSYFSHISNPDMIFFSFVFFGFYSSFVWMLVNKFLFGCCCSYFIVYWWIYALIFPSWRNFVKYSK